MERGSIDAAPSPSSTGKQSLVALLDTARTGEYGSLEQFIYVAIARRFGRISRESRQEVANDVLWAVIEKMNAGVPNTEIAAMLATIIQHKALNRDKSDQRYHDRVELEDPSSSTSASRRERDSDLEQLQHFRHYIEVMNELKHRNLAHFAALAATYREIDLRAYLEEQLGRKISDDTAYQTRRRARKHFQKVSRHLSGENS
jgi:uncharacterized protein YdcH (DUF465 family)